jgi:hypothetical protein
VLFRSTPVGEDSGPFRFPAKIKPVPGRVKRWALADSGHHQIVLLDDLGRELARFGSGQADLADGPGEIAGFHSPQGLVASEQAIYVADTGNHAIRRIDLESGAVATLAGRAERGFGLSAPAPALETARCPRRPMGAAGRPAPSFRRPRPCGPAHPPRGSTSAGSASKGPRRR